MEPKNGAERVWQIFLKPQHGRVISVSESGRHHRESQRPFRGWGESQAWSLEISMEQWLRTRWDITHLSHLSAWKDTQAQDATPMPRPCHTSVLHKPHGIQINSMQENHELEKIPFRPPRGIEAWDKIKLNWRKENIWMSFLRELVEWDSLSVHTQWSDMYLWKIMRQVNCAPVWEIYKINFKLKWQGKEQCE